MRKMFSLLIGILFFISARGQNDSTTICGCSIRQPSSWNSVVVVLPDTITSLQLLEDYCSRQEKDSIGQLRSLKLMYTGLRRLKIFPAYLGDKYFELGRYDEAVTVYRQCISCAKKQHGREKEWECYLYLMIGRCMEEQQRKNEAIDWYRKAIAKKFAASDGKTKEYYNDALCRYRCLMNIRCDR